MLKLFLMLLVNYLIKTHASHICITAIWASLSHFSSKWGQSRPWLIETKMKLCPSCTTDILYMRWQIQATLWVPSVFIIFSPVRIGSKQALTIGNVMLGSVCVCGWGGLATYRFIVYMAKDSYYLAITMYTDWTS